MIMDLLTLNRKDYDLYKQSEWIVSNKYSVKCICGEPCTASHIRTCGKFRKEVDKKFEELKSKGSTII